MTKLKLYPPAEGYIGIIMPDGSYNEVRVDAHEIIAHLTMCGAKLVTQAMIDASHRDDVKNSESGLFADGDVSE